MRIDNEIRTGVKFVGETDADQRRMQQRKATAAKRRISRQMLLDDFDFDVDGLSMPAINNLKARAKKRDGKFRQKGMSMAQPQKEHAKASLQKTRHTENVRARRAMEAELSRYEQDAVLV